MSFWKRFPPGWFAYDDVEEDYGGGFEDGDGGGDDGGGGGGDEGGGDDGGGDDEGDGDGGIDFRYDDDGGNDFNDGGNDFNDDGGNDSFDRQREREDRQREDRQREEDDRRRREEEERQRRIDEQHRQIEEERRRQEEEERRRQQQQTEDSDGDGIPDQGTLEDPNALPSNDPGVDNRLQERFQSYEEQRKAQEQAFDPTNPGWIYQSQGTQAERRAPDQWGMERGPGLRTNDPTELANWQRDQNRETLQRHDTDTTGETYTPIAASAGGGYKLPAIMSPAPPPESAPLKPPETRIPEIAATAAAQAAASAGASPLQIAETAEHAARIASDQQTLANQSAWTRASFRSTYGDQAEVEWARQHEAELARNRSLYGASEPRAGQAPLANAPAGTALAPDRRIGQVAPPVSGQAARYGVNGPAPAGPAAPAVPPTSARVPPAGAVTPAAQGLPGFPGAGAPVINPQQQGFGTYPQPAPPPEPGPSRERGTLPEQPRTPIAAPSALPSGAPTAGEPGGPPLAPGPVLGDSPDDDIIIEDAAMGAQKQIKRKDLPFWQQDVAPGVPSPWRVKSVTPTYEPNRAVPGIRPTPERDSQTSYRPDSIQNVGLPQTSEQVRNIQNVLDAYGPTTGQRMDLRSEDSNVYRPGMSASQDLTDQGFYRPGMQAPAAQTKPGYPDFELYASTDTAVPSATATAGAGPHADPVLAAISTTRPLDTLATLAATNKGPDYDPRQDATHIANGIAAMLRGDRDANGQYVTWAEPYLNDVARIAWAREERQNGRNSDPRNTPVEYVEKWKDGFYGGDERVPMVKELQQEMIDHAAARTPPGQPFRWQEAYGPTGEKGLISRQVTEVDCGPNAFSTILRSRGYNADPRQTYGFAVDNKYHTSRRLANGSITEDGEFTGPANYARMLREEAGLQTEEVAIKPDGTNWDRIDQELVEGRPVTLSSPGHYWVISAKDPNTGKYYAGGTTLQKNPEWLDRGGFVYKGAPNVAIFARGDVNPNSRAVQTMKLPPPATATPNTRPLLSGQTEFQGGPPPARGPASGPSNAQEPENFSEYVRYGASKRGLDPEQVAAVMGKEGPEGWGSVGRFDSGTSYGPLQLHYAGGPRPQVGMGDDFTKATGIDLRTVDPKTPEGIRAHKMAVDYALDRLIKTGDYREWYGADKAFPGQGRYTPIKRVTPQAPQRTSERAPGGEPLMMRANLGSSDSNLGMPESLENVRSLSPRERLGNRISMEMYKESGSLPDYPGDYDPRAAGPQEAGEGSYQGPRQLAPIAAAAQGENPWDPDPAAQQARHAGMRAFHEMPPEERQSVFEQSLDAALDAEKITDPAEREHWKTNMRKIVLGDGTFPGENPTLNPFAMAGENKGTPLYASDPRDKSPRSNELNSSAMGYYQFIVNDPRDPSKDPYGHKAFIPEGRNFFDPVTQHRMFIRAVLSSKKHHGDPASVTNEKRRTKVWGP